jgi:cell division transport system permease protein
MGTAMVPVDAVWPTILTYSLAGGALVGALGSMFSIRKHLNV